MKIFLIGLPGSGKTTVGKELAEKMKIPFIDLDIEIEKAEGNTVQEIFSQKGEDYFRGKEHTLLKEFCATNDSFVMATGGGTPSFFDNITSMNQSGKTIFLDVPTAVIVSRLMKTDLNKRPLFSNLSSAQLEEKIEALHLKRIASYKKANFIFAGADISPENI